MVLLVGFVLIAFAGLHLRAEQARSAARTLALESRWVELRRELWGVQTEVARLRAPERIHEWLERFEVELAPPELPTPALAHYRLAADRAKP